MPTTVNSDLIIYDDLAQTAFLERRQDNLEVFNAASNGAIILDNELIEGDFRKRTFYKVGGSIESRNVNSTDPVTGKKSVPANLSASRHHGNTARMKPLRRRLNVGVATLANSPR